MTPSRGSFDAESLGALDAVLDQLCRELAGEAGTPETDKPVISREQLAKLILHHAQDGESDPERLRTLVLKELGRG